MERLFRYILTLLISLLAMGQFVQIITRYILEVPVMGLEEALIYPTLWLYMLGAVNASRENTQIRANVLDLFLKSQLSHRVLAAISDLISLVVGCWLFYWIWDFAKYILRVQKESPTLYWPTVYADFALVIGMGLVLFYTAFHLFTQVREIAAEMKHG